MTEADRKLLTDAIARNCAMVLSLPSAGLLRNQKSRFLFESPEGFWVQVDPQEQGLIEQLLDTGQPVGIAFRSGVQKVTLVASAIQYDRAFKMNAETSLAALHLRFPTEIRAVQRRSNYRARVYADGSITARVWRIAPKVLVRDRPMASQEVKLELRDLSLGGMGVILHGEHDQPPKITMDDRLRVEITLAETVLVVEGIMRHPSGPQPQNAICTGIRFVELDSSLEGRRTLSQLTRIVGSLQREEVRRARYV